MCITTTSQASNSSRYSSLLRLIASISATNISLDTSCCRHVYFFNQIFPKTVKKIEMQPNLYTLNYMDTTGKTKKNIQRNIWMLTCCPTGSGSLAHTLHQKCYMIKICQQKNATLPVTGSWTTYIVLNQRCRLPKIETFLENMKESHGIRKTEVYVYEPVGTFKLSTIADAPKL